MADIYTLLPVRITPKARVATALALASAVLAYAVESPRASLRPVTVEDLAPEPNPGKSHNEFWTYQFWLNDGIQVQFNLSRVNFGSLKDPVCGADLAVAGFRDRNHFVAREYPVRNFAWDPAEARLAVHKNIFMEGFPPQVHRVSFSTRKDGRDYFLDLIFDQMTPGVAWGDGIFRLGGGEETALFFHIPKARVRGRLGIGGDTIAVRGFGWMDHTRQTQFATRILDAGYRYVVTSGRAEGGYFFQQGGTVFGYGIREENGEMVLLKPAKIAVVERASWGGTSVPRVLEFALDGRDPILLRRTEDRQRISVLHELSSLQRFGARMYLGGEVLGYRGVAKVDDSLPAMFSFTVVKR
jgi:hypothetical protein